MTRYLLDTDVLINASKHRDPDRAWILGHIRGGDSLTVCAVTLAEFYSGLPRGRDTLFDAFIDQLPVIDVTAELALTAGGYRYSYARQGVQLATADCLIAAAAVHAGATLVTYNGKDYPMPEVTALAPAATP